MCARQGLKPVTTSVFLYKTQLSIKAQLNPTSLLSLCSSGDKALRVDHGDLGSNPTLALW